MWPYPGPRPLLLDAVLQFASVAPADFTALVVAAGTALAGYAAFRRIRIDRPKVVEEVAGLASARLREELDTAWETVDKLRRRERELEGDVDQAYERIRKLERDRTYWQQRVEALERTVATFGLEDRDRGHG